jgi:aminopeptidase N
VETELGRDQTDAGQRRAQSCLAAIPDAAAKAAAWARIVDPGVPNAAFRAALRGFQDPDQDELLVPYAEKFYAALPLIWQDGASDVARFFTKVGYPASAVNQEAIDRTTQYIASGRPPAALERLLIEGQDEVVRALHCQQGDARPR